MTGTVRRLRSWNVASGNFFFRYRNALFPLLIIGGMVTLRPSVIMGSMVLYRILIYSGLAIALLGQAVRLVTIGFKYIPRGGKNGHVYARRLVQGGVYGITRNPLYVGNALIAIGMTMLLGSLLGFLLLIPFFLLVYQAIVAAEEAYLSDKFGRKYDQYRAAVNRFVPSMDRIPQAFSGMRFDWRESLRRDIGTVVGLTIGLIFIPVWRTYFLHGWDATQAVAIQAFLLSTIIGAIYFFLIRLKKNKQLFQNSGQRQKSGRRALLNNRPEIALQRFTNVAQMDPNFVATLGPLYQGIWTYIGRSYYAMGKFTEAGQALDRALTFYKDDPLARLYLGLIELRTKDRTRSPKPFLKEEILYALKQGVTSPRMVTLVRDRGVAFKWTSKDDRALRRSGASASLIGEIQRLGAEDQNSQSRPRQTGSQTVETVFREILGQLQHASNTSAFRFWDASGNIRSRLRNTLTVNSAQALDAESLISEGEWVARELDKEVGRVRRATV